MKVNIVINGIIDNSPDLVDLLNEYNLEDIVFIDSNKRRVDELNDKFPHTIALHGDSLSSEFLEKAGLGREGSKTIFVSLTTDDALNLTSCQLVINKFDVEEVISTVNDSENIKIFNSCGINKIFHSHFSLASTILNSAGITLPVKLMDISQKGTGLWAVTIQPSSSLVGLTISELKMPFRALILGKIDNLGNPYNSSEDVALDEWDMLFVISSKRNQDLLGRFFQGEKI